MGQPPDATSPPEHCRVRCFPSRTQPWPLQLQPAPGQRGAGSRGLSSGPMAWQGPCVHTHASLGVVMFSARLRGAREAAFGYLSSEGPAVGSPCMNEAANWTCCSPATSIRTTCKHSGVGHSRWQQLAQRAGQGEVVRRSRTESPQPLCPGVGLRLVGLRGGCPCTPRPARSAARCPGSATHWSSGGR